ncbi:hypothetical protein [Alteromonas gracilis]|uniref:hypothetical protein n=1 Tax=Alteromonas gracilis TaxID=1479524 RepID=UPI0030D448B0
MQPETKQQLLDDLDFAAKLARDGANTPLLGGTYFIIWSGLLVPTLILHGATIDGFLPISANYVGLMWMAYGIVGTVLSTIYGFKARTKKGINSWLNRLSRTAGITVSVLIFSFAVAMTVSVAMGKFEKESFNLILPFAFALQTFHLTILGRLSQKAYLISASYFAAISMLVTLIFNDLNLIYYFSAFSVLLTMTLPGFLEIRDETKND